MNNLELFNLLKTKRAKRGCAAEKKILIERIETILDKTTDEELCDKIFKRTLLELSKVVIKEN